MPYRWQDEAAHSGPARKDAPHGNAARDRGRLVIWPHRSLPAAGFAWVIGLAAAGLALPILSMLGRAVLWGLLPFAGIAVGGLWMAIRASNRQGRMHEVVDLSRDRITVTRHDPGRPDRVWTANPYWVRLRLHARPVEDYLTLTDGGREIELGAFLAPEERRALRYELSRALLDLRG